MRDQERFMIKEDTETSRYSVAWMQKNARKALECRALPADMVITVHDGTSYVPLAKPDCLRKIGIFYGATQRDFTGAEIIEEDGDGALFYRIVLSYDNASEAEEEILISEDEPFLCPFGTIIGSENFFKMRARDDFLYKMHRILDIPSPFMQAAILEKELMEADMFYPEESPFIYRVQRKTSMQPC